MTSILLALAGLRIDGGIAVVSRCVARALDEEITAGRLERADRVLLFDDPSDAPPPPARGEQRFCRGSHARFAWEIWRALRRHRHDLVLFDVAGLARWLPLLPGVRGTRCAIFVHGTELGLAKSGSRARAVRQADVLLAISRFTAGMLERSFPDVRERIRVIPLCVDPERVALWESDGGADAPARREPAVLIVGRMWKEERGKGHRELIAAWPSVRCHVPDAELWIAGSGSDVPRLERKARAACVGDAIRFLGHVPDAALGTLYRRASVFAMPSRQEGFGLVYAEAMWWGMPCVGSTVDAAGQVIADGETGLLVPYGDAEALSRALVSLLADPQRADRMGEAGRRRIREQFAYARFRDDLLAALDVTNGVGSAAAGGSARG